MSKQNSSEQPSTIFISHRHRDRRIADIFRKAFTEWGDGEINIFQSSYAGTAPGVGDKLGDAIRQAAAAASVLLLIYTVTDDDWTWCMYECGLAQDPKTLDTRILAYHTTVNPPAPLQHLVTLPMSIESLEILVDQFHKKPNFFHEREEAIAPTTTDEQIRQRSRALHESLLGEIQDVQAKTTIRYDQIVLSIPLVDVDQVRAVYEEESFAETVNRFADVIADKCLIESICGEPQIHFNFEGIPDNLKLAAVIKRWKRESAYSDLAWDLELYTEIIRAILGIKEGTISLPFNSINPDSNVWFLPVLHSIRTVPQEGKMEFNVVLNKLKARTAKAMIGKIV